jgi:hypothetical protein
VENFGISCDVNCSCFFLEIDQFPLMVFNISLFIGSDHFGIMEYNNYMYGIQVIMSADAITIKLLGIKIYKIYKWMN